MNRALLAAIILVPVLFVAPSSIAAQLSQPKIERLAGGGVRVINSGPSAWKEGGGWQLVLETTIQPAEGGPGELANPSGILRTTDGRFVIADMTAPTVRLYDRTGRFVREIGRSGEGPGEFRQPRPALFHDTLVIHDGRLHRVSVMTLEGKVARTFAVPNTNACCEPPTIDANGRLALPAFGAGGHRYRRYTMSGQPLDSIVVPPGPPSGTWKYPVQGGEGAQDIPFAARIVKPMLRDGTLLYGNSREYQLRVTRSGHDTLRLIDRRAASSTPIRPALRDSIFHLIVDRNADLRAVASLNDVPKDYPYWSSAFEDAAANIWVLLGGGATSPMRFDVFTHEGRLLGSITAPFTWSSPNITFLGDRIGAIDTDSNDLPRVRIYRIITR